MSLALAFASALFLSVTLLPVLMRNAARLGLVDYPSEARKIHTELKPRIGGIGIVVASFLSAGYWLRAARLPLGLISGGVMLALANLSNLGRCAATQEKAGDSGEFDPAMYHPQREDE